MIQIEDEVYQKLLKDANDNKQLVNIIKIIVFGIVLLSLFFMIFFCWGKDLMDLDIQRRRAELDTQIALSTAETNARILEIEKGDMSMDDYVKWINARKSS